MAAAFGLKALLLRAYEARWTLRVISVTAAAAGAAWAVCLPFGDFAPAFGAASAVYAVQLTVRTSVLDGARRTALMGVSVLLAVLILKTVGLSAIAVMVLVFVSLGVGQLLRLGVSGSLQIPGTAIFILALGTSITTEELLNRVWATLVGAVIGAAASYLAYPGDPQGRARHALAEIAASISGLLSDMSAGVARTPTAADTELWLARSRSLDDEVGRVRPLVDEAVAFLRVDPFGRKASSTELSQALTALEHSVTQIRGIARTLFDHRIDGAPQLPPSLAEVLSRTAVAYHARAALPAWMPPSRLSAKRAANRCGVSGEWTRRARGSCPEPFSPTWTGWWSNSKEPARPSRSPTRTRVAALGSPDRPYAVRTADSRRAFRRSQHVRLGPDPTEGHSRDRRV